MAVSRYGQRIAVLLFAAFAAVAVPVAGQTAVGNRSLSPDLARSRKLREEGKQDQAIALLNQIVQKDPNGAGLQAQLGKTYYEKRDYLQAIPHLKSALKQQPDDGESTQLLGLSYYLVGHLQQAIPLLEKVHSQLPRPDVTGSYILGTSYLQSAIMTRPAWRLPGYFPSLRKGPLHICCWRR